jgi:4-hydroxybenzoate polyprenyltransferase
MPEPTNGIAGLRALALSCHPLPTLAVTALSAGLAALASDRLGAALLLVGSVFAGQLSIGWSNDWIDAGRDRTNRRTDKPAALGAVCPAVVGAAGLIAGLLAAVGCAGLGFRPGVASGLILVCGWAYNLGLKATVWSWAPYAIAFGSLPAAAALNAPGSPAPALWAVAAGALLGVAAHLANVLPDLTDDARTGVNGLPHRLGQRGTAVAGPAIMVTATVVAVVGPRQPVSPYGWVALGLSAIIGSAAAVAGARHPSSRLYLLATVAVAAIDLGLFAFPGHRLS